MNTSTECPAPEVDDLDAADVLVLLQDTDIRIRAAERDKLNLVAHWCVLHPAKSATGEEADHAQWSDSGHRDMLDCDEALGGDGAPLVAAFAAEEVATALRISPLAAMQLIADVLNLQHRHPMFWARVQSLEVSAWRARRLAQRSASVSFEAARWVDEQLVGRADSCGPTTIDRSVTEAKALFEPEELADAEQQDEAAWHVRLFHGATGEWAGTSTLDAVGDTNDLSRFHDVVCRTAEELREAGDEDTFEQRKAKALGVIADRLDGSTPSHRRRRGGRPRFYLHLDAAMLGQPTGVGAVEQLGPATAAKLRTWLAGSRVTVQPVLHMDRADAVDSHQPPSWMQELVRLRDRHCVFPWCERDARACDLDHIVPYDPGTEADPGPPGQTRPDNLAPLCRRHHRCKTSGRWRYQRDRDGSYGWTSPHQRHHVVTSSGTSEV